MIIRKYDLKICMYNITSTIKIGGIETYCWEVSRELNNLGHDVELISGQGEFIKYKNIKLKQFSYTKREKIFDLGNRFKKWGERLSFFKNTYSYLKKSSYDILIIHKPMDFFVCYFMKKITPDIKTVFVSGGEDFYGFDKFFSKYVDIMISVSEDNKRKIEKRYNRKVNVIPNGVDTDKFFPDELLRKNMRTNFKIDNKKVLISVGRVVALKGFQLVIDALKELDKDFIYVLIGDGEYLSSLKSKVKESKLENRVSFLGSIDNKELPRYLNMGDIYIQPTIGNEAFGITIIEAMACGLPVVASKNGGIVDIIEDTKNGYLFEINNITEMIEKITFTLSTQNEISKQSLNTSQEYSWFNCVKKLNDLIMQ